MLNCRFEYNIVTAHSRAQTLRRPPYAIALAKRFGTGWRPANGTIHVAAGPRAWDLARGWQTEPDWRAWFIVPDMTTYDLTVVRGFDCILHCRGLSDDETDRIAAALVIAGAPRVVTTTSNRIVSYRPLRSAA